MRLRRIGVDTELVAQHEQALTGRCVPLSRRPLVPHERSSAIETHPAAVLVQHPEVVLRLGKGPVGGAVQPTGRERVVTANPQSNTVEGAEVELRFRDFLLRREAIPANRLRHVAFYPAPGGVHDAQVVLGLRKASIRGRAKPSHCFAVVAHPTAAGGEPGPEEKGGVGVTSPFRLIEQGANVDKGVDRGARGRLSEHGGRDQGQHQ